MFCVLGGMRYRILSHDTGMNGQKFAEICKFIVSVLLSAGKTLHAISAPVADVVRRVDFSPYKCEHTQCLATLFQSTNKQGICCLIDVTYIRL